MAKKVVEEDWDFTPEMPNLLLTQESYRMPMQKAKVRPMSSPKPKCMVEDDLLSKTKISLIMTEEMMCLANQEAMPQPLRVLFLKDHQSHAIIVG